MNRTRHIFLSAMNLFQLTYLSKSELHPLGLHEELEIIQKTASELNREKQITGILIYRDGYFLHRLEGNRKDIIYLAERIAADRRHSQFKILSQGAIATRITNHDDPMRIVSTKRDTHHLQPLLQKLTQPSSATAHADELEHALRQIVNGQMQHVA